MGKNTFEIVKAVGLELPGVEAARRYDALVLVRLSQVNRDALHDLRSVSRRLALENTRRRGQEGQDRQDRQEG